jgi:hypothetical protein
LMDKSSFAIYFPILLVKLGISVVSRCLSGCWLSTLKRLFSLELWPSEKTTTLGLTTFDVPLIWLKAIVVYCMNTFLRWTVDEIYKRTDNTCRLHFLNSNDYF